MHPVTRGEPREEPAATEPELGERLGARMASHFDVPARVTAIEARLDAPKRRRR